ncbi:hypothetical protein EX30DRAFT_337079 [Ascodesmis nigricans]|uniref:Uncharacterized protein n=1 Tax=Ascodesmis nigricans TaxID=341454 RepID=A0A4S2N5T3_9PEZI|nr:hypothetical protein EX30DRAFT_337079 [Ascodesmis nigricans]
MATPETKKHSPLDSTHPILVPFAEELFYDVPSFNEYIASLPIPATPRPKKTPEEVAEKLDEMDLVPACTENNDVTNLTAGEPLVDLFNDLTRNVSSQQLNELLHNAWEKDPLMTLKLIWNARSIHVGKSERMLWYRCMGWLREYHPRTLLANLEWIVRPVIQKKMMKEEEEGTDVGGESMIVEKKELDDVNDSTRFDVENGVSHGYYRDLGNLLLIAAHHGLNRECDPEISLRKFADAEEKAPESEEQFKNQKPKGQDKKRKRTSVREGKRMRAAFTKEEEEKYQQELEKKKQEQKAKSEKAKAEASELRHKIEAEKQQNIINMFTDENDAFYKALHLSVARIFGSQIKRDIEYLDSTDFKHHRKISLAAKWAPSLELAVDRSTLLASSIAEILFPPEKIDMSAEPRELYLKQARQRYRIQISKLRAMLDVVERKISANDLSNINFSKVPSLAMNRYKDLFAKKDEKRFREYLNDVAAGKVKISGAVMLPSTLVAAVRALNSNPSPVAKLSQQVADGQWNTLVQRIRDSGTFDNCIAVCDVSGSMCVQVGDKTTAMDSAIGLSLIIASVAKEPFNNRFITFSSRPAFVSIDPAQPFSTQVLHMERADWEMNTNFLAVFKDLLLPTAITHKVPPENMIKRIFVFSDMEFDAAATGGGDSYKSSFDVIKEKYAQAGYEVPELVFWNLAGVRGYGDYTQKKPVTVDDVGTCLVSGYSQAMLKVFMDNGGFEDAEDEEELMEVEMGEDGEVVEKKKEKKKIDPLAIVKKATDAPCYEMLRVVD